MEACSTDLGGGGGECTGSGLWLRGISWVDGVLNGLELKRSGECLIEVEPEPEPVVIVAKCGEEDEVVLALMLLLFWLLVLWVWGADCWW
jgi:hypothetical protein